MRRMTAAATAACLLALCNGADGTVGAQVETRAASVQETQPVPNPSSTLTLQLNPYDFYPRKLPHPLMSFTVRSNSTGTELRELQVPYLGRWPPEILWIDDRFALLLGERYSAIVDAVKERTFSPIDGDRLKISPDRTKVAFVYRPLTSRTKSGKPLSESVGMVVREERSSHIVWEELPVYPAPPGWNPVRPDQLFDAEEVPIEERRYVQGMNLFWSPDSERLAFLERQDEQLYLTILRIRTTPEKWAAPFERVPIADWIDPFELRDIRFRDDEVDLVLPRGIYPVSLEGEPPPG